MCQQLHHALKSTATAPSLSVITNASTVVHDDDVHGRLIVHEGTAAQQHSRRRTPTALPPPLPGSNASTSKIGRIKKQKNKNIHVVGCEYDLTDNLTHHHHHYHVKISRHSAAFLREIKCTKMRCFDEKQKISMFASDSIHIFSTNRDLSAIIESFVVSNGFTRVLLTVGISNFSQSVLRTGSAGKRL